LPTGGVNESRKKKKSPVTAIQYTTAECFTLYNAQQTLIKGYSIVTGRAVKNVTQ